MNPKLIYHTPESMAGGPSPFDSAIMSLIDGQDLRITCPYLGIDYLKRMVERADSWRLVTDIHEWLSSHSEQGRMEIVDFVLENAQRIRHCRDLHAKVLVGGTKALSGSANFTEKGVTGRVEVSVLFDGGEEVEELRSWFDLLWSQTAPVSEAELRSCTANMAPANPSSSTTALSCIFPGVSSTLCRLGADGGTLGAEERLINRLRLAPDRRWAESWLDLAKELLEVTGLTNDDERLVMSLPQGRFLPITINRRYVLTAFRIDEGQHEKRWLIPDYTDPPGYAVVELILPGSMKNRIDGLHGVIRHSMFDAGFSAETADNVPRFVSFSMPSEFTFPPEVLEAWQEAAIAECDHQRTSNFRKYHEPVVYRAATDLDYRRRLLDRAFPTR